MSNYTYIVFLILQEVESVKNENNVGTENEKSNDIPMIKKKIGQTTYTVKIHFDDKGTETYIDKVKRVMKNEILNKDYEQAL